MNLELLEWWKSTIYYCAFYYWFVNSKNFLKSRSDDTYFEVEDEINPEENSLER